MRKSTASSKSAASDFEYSPQGLPYTASAASKRVTSTNWLHRSPHSETDEPQYSPTAGDNASTSSNRKYNIDASQHDGDWPRSQLAASISVRGSLTSLNTRTPTISSLTSAALSIPQIRVNEAGSGDSALDRRSNNSNGDSGRWLYLDQPRLASAASGEDGGKDIHATSSGFRGISLDINIPTGGFSEELSTNSIEFSKRGSMLIDGRRVNSVNRKPSPNLTPIMDDEKRESGEPVVDAPITNVEVVTAPNTPSGRAPAKELSADEVMLSEKVRAFYAAGTDDPHETESTTNLATRMGARWQAALVAEARNVSGPSLSCATSTTDVNDDINNSRQPSMTTSTSQTYMLLEREENELAGGLEDWKDIDNADVDRYGFILARAPSTVDGADESKPQRITRVTTSLQLASETPRRRHTLRRTPSSAHGSTRSGHEAHSSPHLTPPRPASSQSAFIRSHSGRRSGRIPVPSSRNRRLMDTAMDMLTLPRSAQSVVENGRILIDDARARRKELEREEKWRKMAQALPQSKDPKSGLPIVGGGSESGYTFDTTSPKLVERTWKGIPDKWRATAWHSFLSASASRDEKSLSDTELITLFHNYQSQSSPDDVQIDIDVPRTISAHIMFRRRYRGGQRLLFRVLHAMSLHFAETGYVQGMAALAVTLLAYYDEEKAFIMLVRMWELRGLEKLYKAGFGGLMAALDDFEKNWLGRGEVARKLVCVLSLIIAAFL